MFHFFKFFATGFGAGYLPKAPGTWGTLLAILPVYLLQSYVPEYYLMFTIAFIIFSVWVSSNAIKIFNDSDPSIVVIDEIAGFLVTMLFVPFSYLFVGIAFVLFRLFDILKPWPICWLDKRLGGGWGIVLDDVMAGIYACVLLHLFMEFVL